jgi:hypothetical protein
MRALMLRFASLGDNCELGMAQKLLNANPMDLLRWAGTHPTVLLKLLDADFKDIGEGLVVRAQGRAHVVENPQYGFRWHDWTRPGKDDPTLIAQREARRLPAMAAKLRKEMREASRIFVIKQTQRPMREELARQVLDRLSRQGQPTLMFVTADAPIGVRWVAPRLLHGTLPRFADGSKVPATTNAEDWAALCQAAASLVDAAAKDEAA